MISVVIPSYNEEENIADCAREITSVLENEEYELIFVDDGSRDLTWQKICEISGEHVRGLRFSRNFGKEAAIRAGLDACAGDAAVVIDCDLQHPPAVIPEMIRKWRDGAKVVEGKKSYRGKEGSAHGFSAKVFNKLMSNATGFDMSDASDFILLDRSALDALLSYNESGSFFRALAQFVGFEHEVVYYQVNAREKGKGKFTLGILISYAVRNIAAFSALPLYLSLFAGLSAVAASAVLYILKWCGVPLGSFSAGVITLMLIGGMILSALGVIGYYLSRIYDEIKHRPKYIISHDTRKE